MSNHLYAKRVHKHQHVEAFLLFLAPKCPPTQVGMHYKSNQVTSNNRDYKSIPLGGLSKTVIQHTRVSQEITLFHELLKGRNYTLVTSGILYEQADAILQQIEVRPRGRVTNAVGTIFRKILVGTRARPI